MREILLPHGNETAAAAQAEEPMLVERLAARFTLSAYAATVGAGAIAAIVLVAFAAGVRAFPAFDQWPLTRPIAAFCILNSAIAMFLLQCPQLHLRRIGLGISLTLFAMLGVVLFLPGIGGGLFENAMAQSKALLLLFLQLAVICAYINTVAARRAARILGATVAALAFTGLLGVGFTTLLGYPPLIQLSLPGGMAMVLLGYSSLIGRSDHWLAEQLANTRPSTILIRRLLPVVIMLPVLLAVARVWAEHAGWINTPVGVLITMLATVVILTVMVLSTAYFIERAQADRETAQRVAEAQRRWLHVTLAGIDDAVIAVDPDLIVQVINPAAEKLIGIDGSALFGKSLAGEGVLTQGNGEPIAFLSGALHGEAMQQRIVTLRLYDRREKDVEISTAPIRSTEGELLGGVMVMRDVSELQRKERDLRTAYGELDVRVAERTRALEQANSALHESLALFRGISESTPDLIIVKNTEGRILMANPAVTEALGRAEPEIVGRSIGGLVEDEDFVRRELEHDLRVIESGRVERGEQLLDIGGRPHTFLTTKSPLRDVGGSIAGLITVATDITERKRIENDLLEAQRFTQGLLDTAPLVLYLRNLTTGRIVFASGMVLGSLGYTTDELLDMDGEALLELIHPEDRDILREHSASYDTEPKGLKHFELRFRHRDGDWRWLHCRERLFEGASSARLALGVAVDVTDRRQAEQELEQLISMEQRLRLEAERANRAKDEFLAIVSHELRSPLNALRGWSFLLGNSRDADGSLIERATQAIKRNVDHQARLIDDLLDTSRIMSGKLTLERRPLDLVQTVAGAIETVRPTAVAKRIDLRFNSSRNLSIDGDPARMQQIVVNLLTNAVKFTPEEGCIEIGATAVGEFARLTVKDSGIGIEPDFLPRVFDRFSQADTSTTRKHGGLGIGLALVRHLAEMHSGRAYAESAGRGQGATFTIEIPLPRSAPVGEQPNAPAVEIQNDSLAGVRICAVDDDPDARDVINATLQRAGATVHSASSGTDLIAILDRLLPGERPDVVILDLAMPGEDGFAVLGNVRALEKRKGMDGGDFIPAIAVTAFTDIERSRVLEKGFSEHVGKPFDPSALVSAILRVSPQAAARAAH
jgi:PAS domain S-box-containing protein